SAGGKSARAALHQPPSHRAAGRHAPGILREIPMRRTLLATLALFLSAARALGQTNPPLETLPQPNPWRPPAPPDGAAPPLRPVAAVRRRGALLLRGPALGDREQ